jgi:molecular chaperone GrpE (heat shock protein)
MAFDNRNPELDSRQLGLADFALALGKIGVTLDNMEATLSSLATKAEIDSVRDAVEGMEARLDVVISTLATKADVSDLETDVHEAFDRQAWELVASMFTCSVMIAVAFFIAKNLH